MAVGHPTAPASIPDGKVIATWMKMKRGCVEAWDSVSRVLRPGLVDGVANAIRLLSACWWLLAVLQLCWHALIPTPWGNSNWIIAAVAVLPLLALAPVALYRGPRGQFWGMFLVMLYFVVGITEFWSSPAQRAAAAVQIALCLGYFVAMVWISRLQSHP